MSKDEPYVYVLDNHRGDRVWVRENYVKLYPHLYTPIQFNGKTMTSDCPNANPCVVKT
jgi:hypothetical protein